MAGGRRKISVNMIYDEECSHGISLASKVKARLSKSGIKCLDYIEQGEDGGWEFDQRDDFILQSTWSLIIWTNPESKTCIHGHNVAVANALHRKRINVIYLQTEHCHHILHRDFPAIVVKGEKWLDDLRELLRRPPMVLKESHYFNINKDLAYERRNVSETPFTSRLRHVVPRSVVQQVYVKNLYKNIDNKMQIAKSKLQKSSDAEVTSATSKTSGTQSKRNSNRLPLRSSAAADGETATEPATKRRPVRRIVCVVICVIVAVTWLCFTFYAIIYIVQHQNCGQQSAADSRRLGVSPNRTV